MIGVTELSLEENVGSQSLSSSSNRQQSSQNPRDRLRGAIERARKERLTAKNSQNQSSESRVDQNSFCPQTVRLGNYGGIELSLTPDEINKLRANRKRSGKLKHGNSSKCGLSAEKVLLKNAKRQQYQKLYDKAAKVFLGLGIALAVAAPFSSVALPVLAGLSLICFIVAFILPMIGRMLSTEMSR